MASPEYSNDIESLILVDKIGNVSVQKHKLVYGVDGSYTDITASNGFPTSIVGPVALPAGASTSALQTTGNSSLSSIDAKTPALGQNTSANANSSANYDVSATAISDGTKVDEFYILGPNVINIPLDGFLPLIQLGLSVDGTTPETLTIAAQSLGASATTACSIQWDENQ